MSRLLIQTQLSNVVNGKFDLACDSGWQMTINRAREMLKLNPELHIDIMGPQSDEQCDQLIGHPYDVNVDLWDAHGIDSDDDESDGRLQYVGHYIIPNALVTRYDFDWFTIGRELQLSEQKLGIKPKYDAVYINDPMQLRAFKAMFHVVGGYQPKFYVHSHFVDVPEVPKFPKEASLWLGQCEAALKADYNFWQCESAMLQFFDSMGKWFTQDVIDDVRAKSQPWDDGYSSSEITSPIDEGALRFTREEWDAKTRDKVVVFLPNRISPSSGDYTNGVRFMFELLPDLRKVRQDFVIVCGNPNLKFTNDELVQRCGANGYVKLHDFTLNRDEFKFVASHSHIALGLYNADAYGGTAARECVELGCMPLWLDNYEYSSVAREADEANSRYFLARPDFSDLVNVLDARICSFTRPVHKAECAEIVKRLQRVIKDRCSYESTTPAAMKRMGLL